jgi:SAM-dependent methyltransferase
MNEFSQALLAYHNGDFAAEFLIRRDDGYQDRVPVSLFFDGSKFSPLECKALDLCSGRVLDVGAAAGRHSLSLIRRGRDVTSLDILPEMESILWDRGAEQIVISDIMAFSQEAFDTVLMLMNGIGMVGTLGDLREFLRNAHRIVSPGGQILCDSVDVSVTSNATHVAYRNQNAERGNPLGQQTLTIEYNGIAGKPFPWIHIDFESLAQISGAEGWDSELITQDEGGHFLCRLTKSTG